MSFPQTRLKLLILIDFTSTLLVFIYIALANTKWIE